MTPLPNAALVSPLQPLKALVPMLVTLSGIVTPVTEVLPWKALLPIAVTARLLVALGIVTAPPEPVYPVMVIVPLLVVKVNWAWTVVSAHNTRSAERILAMGRVFIFMCFLAFRALSACGGGSRAQR